VRVSHSGGVRCVIERVATPTPISIAVDGGSVPSSVSYRNDIGTTCGLWSTAAVASRPNRWLASYSIYGAVSSFEAASSVIHPENTLKWTSGQVASFRQRAVVHPSRYSKRANSNSSIVTSGAVT
jgi:hypothetical protein